MAAISEPVRGAFIAVHNSPQKEQHRARKVEAVRENASPDTAPSQRRPRKRRLRLTIDIESSNAASAAATAAQVVASGGAIKRVGLDACPNAPLAPDFTVFKPLASYMQGAKSGQGAIYAKRANEEAFKCKVFDMSRCAPGQLQDHAQLTGFIKALLTGYFCPEVVVPTSLAKQADGTLITMQPIQASATDLYRLHKTWLTVEGNSGTVIDYLKHLFQDRPDLEEAFIVASLAEITLGSIDSKAPNTLFDATTNQFLLCDTDISLNNVSFTDEGILTAETGKFDTYLCEGCDSEGKRLAFMDTPFREVVAKHPRVRAFLAKPDRATSAVNEFLSSMAHRDLISLSHGDKIVEEGSELVDRRIQQLLQLEKSGATLSELLVS